MRKPSLTEKEFGHLQTFAQNGMLAKRMPKDTEKNLTEQGHIKAGLGGYVLTEKAMALLSNNGETEHGE